jgi:hypothetical protein
MFVIPISHMLHSKHEMEIRRMFKKLEKGSKHHKALPEVIETERAATLQYRCAGIKA